MPLHYQVVIFDNFNLSQRILAILILKVTIITRKVLKLKSDPVKGGKASAASEGHS